MSRVLKPQPLTAEAFAPFGDVIAADGAAATINYGATQKYADLAAIRAEGGGRVAVHLYRSTPPAYPFVLRVMENHPLGSQMFVPLSGRPYLVVVAPKGRFDPHAIAAFIAGPGQGVNYAPGTWHHYSLAVGGPSEFLVIDREGPGENLEEIVLDDIITVSPPDAG
jgi:ureidoglycolate lyase